MATVTINSIDYTVYGDLEDALEYLGADPNAATFRAATEEEQGRWLVGANRYLDRQPWLGEKEDEDQAQAFPRTGMGLSDIDDDEVPADIIYASYELASALANGFNPATTSSAAQSTKRLKADTVEIEYFRGAEGSPYRFPIGIWELIRRYIQGPSTATAYASGTCGDSITDRDYGFNSGI